MIELCNIPDCEREIKEKFCEQHLIAKEKLDEAFTHWQIAFGNDFTKEKYYTELLDNTDVKTGQWVKDVILYQLDDESS